MLIPEPKNLALKLNVSLTELTNRPLSRPPIDESIFSTIPLKTTVLISEVIWLAGKRLQTL